MAVDKGDAAAVNAVLQRILALTLDKGSANAASNPPVLFLESLAQVCAWVGRVGAEEAAKLARELLPRCVVDCTPHVHASMRIMWTLGRAPTKVVSLLTNPAVPPPPHTPHTPPTNQPTNRSCQMSSSRCRCHQTTWTE